MQKETGAVKSMYELGYENGYIQCLRDVHLIYESVYKGFGLILPGVEFEEPADFEQFLIELRRKSADENS